jgi:hypothetical protein
VKRLPIVFFIAICVLGLLSCAGRGPSQASRSTGRAPTTVSANAPGEIPAGTTLEIRTNENINANTATAGRSYSAELANDVVRSGGGMLIPAGSPARLAVLSTGTGSTPDLELGVQSISVNGRNYTVSTDPVTKGGNEGVGRNRRTAEMVGGGALLGTLLGAVAGGGKGAAVGAIAGAAAGAGAQVLTKGKEVRVPAETLLRFRLDQPLYLR